MGDASAGVHLRGPMANGRNQLIAQIGRQPGCSIGAATIYNNDLGTGRVLTQIR